MRTHTQTHVRVSLAHTRAYKQIKKKKIEKKNAMLKKKKGIDLEILIEGVLNNSKNARLKILENMNECINASKKELRSHAPRVDIVNVDIRDLPRVLGTGGYLKRQIEKETLCDLEINFDNECVEITAPNVDALEKCKTLVRQAIGCEIRPRDIVKCKIKSKQPFGVMIELEDGSVLFKKNTT